MFSSAVSCDFERIESSKQRRARLMEKAEALRKYSPDWMTASTHSHNESHAPRGEIVPTCRCSRFDLVLELLRYPPIAVSCVTRLFPFRFLSSPLPNKLLESRSFGTLSLLTCVASNVRRKQLTGIESVHFSIPVVLQNYIPLIEDGRCLQAR